MRNQRLAIFLAALAVVSAAGVFGRAAGAQQRQAVPRDGAEESKPPSAPQRRPPEGERRAVPRAPAPEAQRRDGGEARRGQAQPRREPPRRAEVPQRYHAVPRAYYFPPIDVRRAFYYHPYFGFYYGPYYGPFYPYPGPFARSVRYSTSALRLKVRPVETEVYINGYYAGIVDDFDGVFQRLYLPAGEHQVALRLAGYQTFVVPVRVPPGDTLDITHQMRRLGTGEQALPPPTPRALPREWTEPPDDAAGDEIASPYGILAIRTDPADARILVDGEAWGAVEGQAEFLIHLAAGWHQLEVRRDGYQVFSTRVELSEGHTTRLDVRLTRQ